MELKELKETVAIKKENSFLTYNQEEIENAYSFCEGYKAFLDSAKTEREAVETAIKLSAGFSEYDRTKKYAPGDRVYINNRGKAAAFIVFGTQSIEKGAAIIAAHIDCPHLDLKPYPLYEDGELALLKTHYYGGLRKYQWTATPLSLHGVVILKGGKTVKVNIGEDKSDPCFIISDLLPHLAAEQQKRTLAEGITGEELNVIIGSKPFSRDAESEAIKLNILNILYEKYGIKEGDLITAELQIVPLFNAKDLGLDRSMIAAFGHDDRICAYPALMALLENKAPKRTLICILADKEETGSEGNTGLDSDFIKGIIDDLAKSENAVTTVALRNSKALSADVSAALDPTFKDAFEMGNAAFINHGIVIHKYGGARGKYSTNDASAEYLRNVIDILDEDNIPWQTGELGKIDLGGGGTVAKFIASLGIDTIDMGVPILSMHAPVETAAKCDIYSAFKAFSAFYKNI